MKTISQTISPDNTVKMSTNPFPLSGSLPEMQEVQQQLFKAVGQNSSITNQIGHYLVSSGGKRIRPLLTILSGQCFRPQGKKTQQLVAAGTAIELIHLASLVHDDIIDKAHLRRGKASVNAKWGEKSAVLMGDYLFAKAFHLLAQAGLTTILQLVVVAIQEMCDGELAQEQYKFNSDQSLSDYYQRIYQKTALLLSTCCQAGAIIGGAEPSHQEAMREYGLNLGYAFQISDDLLDFTGDEETLGKPTGSDLIQGNLTLPILLLLQDSHWSPWLKERLTRKHFTEKDLLVVQEALLKTSSLKAAHAKAHHHVSLAKAQLAKLPSSSQLDVLGSLAQLVVSRQS